MIELEEGELVSITPSLILSELCKIRNLKLIKIFGNTLDEDEKETIAMDHEYQYILDVIERENEDDESGGIDDYVNKMIKYLIDVWKCDTFCINSYRETALMVALYQNYIFTAYTIIDTGCESISFRNNFDDDALYVALDTGATCIAGDIINYLYNTYGYEYLYDAIFRKRYGTNIFKTILSIEIDDDNENYIIDTISSMIDYLYYIDHDATADDNDDCMIYDIFPIEYIERMKKYGLNETIIKFMERHAIKPDEYQHRKLDDDNDRRCIISHDDLQPGCEYRICANPISHYYLNSSWKSWRDTTNNDNCVMCKEYDILPIIFINDELSTGDNNE